MKIIHFCVLLIIVLFTSCKKNAVEISVVTDGTYYGSFDLSNTSPVINYAPITGNVTLVMNKQNYTCTSPSTNFGAAARGGFTISGQQIIFRDSTIHTANFDGNIILTGTYNATVRNDSLFLVKTINTSVYTYKLKRQ